MRRGEVLALSCPRCSPSAGKTHWDHTPQIRSLERGGMVRWTGAGNGDRSKSMSEEPTIFEANERPWLLAVLMTGS